MRQAGASGRKRDTGVAAASYALSALLSHILVAFTIECDNEFERQMPHRTTNHPSTAGSHRGPWLVSIVMWWNCMRFVGEHGVRVGELEQQAGTGTNLNGMERWGYVVVEPDPARSQPKSRRSDWQIHATTNGRKAQEVWEPLPDAIERRWVEFYGQDRIGRLRKSLAAVLGRLPFELPDCLPILGYGLFSRGRVRVRPIASGPKDNASDLPLAALLSRVLLAFAVEFEGESELSLAIGSNLLRVLNEEGVPVRDLPVLTGVSKEAIQMAAGILEKKGIAVAEAGPGRAKILRLTTKGRKAEEMHRLLLGTIEERWSESFDKTTMGSLRDDLEALAVDSGTGSSPLVRRLEPYPDGWRASVPQPKTLPHYPMVLHRGGFPDGA